MNIVKSITPFIKWAGGKRQLLDKFQEIIPDEYNRYFEPFVGGGALLFSLEPHRAIINDINKELIFLYETVRDNVDGLVQEVATIDEEHREPYKEYYYERRSEYNKNILSDNLNIRTAALFLYLNKHCFNGLYRVNKKGAFNVPYNNSNSKSIDEENLYHVSDFLKNVDIYNNDFEEIGNMVEKRDLVFLDSPYAPLNDTSFDSYTKTGFTRQDHERLSKLFIELDRRGAYCILTNHNTEIIRNLYKGFNIQEVSVSRMINSDSSNRKGKELIITNYDNGDVNR